ncbi:MAG TPA: hypothetical protein VGB63_03740 [Pedobacter sp.]|jgi:hypothetical protein
MNNDPNLTLINGEFTPADAREILKNVFWSKIQFHEMRNFSSKERHGKEDEIALKRITELKKSLEKLLEIVFEAESNNETLSIQAEICILKSDSKIKEVANLKHLISNKY